MCWGSSVDVSTSIVVAAPHGGPLALMKDPKHSDPSLKPIIFFYSLSGKLLGRFAWTHGRIAHNGLGWSDQCILMIVSEDGTVYQYNSIGNEVGHFDCKDLLEGQTVMDCQFWANGVALMSIDLKIICATLDRYDHSRPPHLSLLHQSPITILPACWIVIPPDPDSDDSHDCLALLSMDAGGVCAVDTMSYQEHAITKGTITKMALSPCGKWLAFFESTCVNVVSSDFSQNIAQFDTESPLPPEQMQWCGSDCVMLTWDQLAFIIGPRGEWLKYDFDEPSRIFTECDSLRIISNSACEMLERVPDMTTEIFSSGSLAPGALLFTAIGHFDEKNPKANDNIRAIFTQLPEAVDSCVTAATLEFSRKTQRKLLRAASLGKAFADSYTSERFVEACKTLRVLNAVREADVGIPLTYEQLQKLTMNGLITRLMDQNKHLLAIRICESMNISPRRVYTHWACQKVRKEGVDEETLGNQVCRMLQDKVGVPYAEIADAAFKAGRNNLAIRLIEHEPRACDQVPLLFSMGRYQLALDKALDSGDTDLVYDVIMKLRLQAKNWFEIIRARPCAMSLLMNLLKTSDESMLVNILRTSEMHVELAEHYAYKAYQSLQVEDMTARLQDAFTEFDAQQKRDASYAFAAHATQDEIRLLLAQREKELSTGKTLCRQPLAETVRELLILGDMKGASKLRTDFKMSDKKFWWLRVQAIAAKSKTDVMAFNQLEALSKERRSPIGYEPFAEVCIDAGLNEEALKYIVNIPEMAKRIPYYVKIGMFREAAECALKTKEPLQYARQILPACKKPDDRAMIEAMFAQVSK